ncbi:FGGY-family carbohydrate kinase [Lacrimispora sp. NSJ-141]|uniref:FGGY-family carbohydrate kinase n=2 Tax=Lientehia hominis TaxID=2897778 RepID=A0AAP2RL12_9FIRM|nr:FGGY-family carbohydrate kinase [Lientehia hominis]MCD2493579.1 FGGY-family carbohydrate kinase [Lientehia hominis]
MMENRNMVKEEIVSGKTVLGIEFGSTRIKAVLIGKDHTPLASGSHDWENRYKDGFWTYTLEDIWTGLQDCYRKMADEVKDQYGETLRTVGAIGFSAMMHGYMAFDGQGKLMVPFRTWRNSNTGEAAKKLTELFHYNIPQRWSIAHLYQAMLNGEAHVEQIDFITTLAGYIHWKLSGERVLGIGDASGMFPIDTEKKEYDRRMMAAFDRLAEEQKLPWRLSDILPQIRLAGEAAGVLTEEGARLLDPSGELSAEIPLCPPEGDAGTGMTATNSVAKRTGNVSAGTSVFSMIVLEKELKKVYPEIDLVTTPSGNLVAMVHANNCTSDLNAWVGLFREFAECMGVEADMTKIYSALYHKALEGDSDCGGLLSYGYLSGENITGLEEGRPLFVRTPESKFSLANFMRTHLFSSLGALKVGLDILFQSEQVKVDEILAHGGLFKTKGVGQRILAAAMNADISVMETAGEGGAWGIALLAAYLVQKEEGESLEDYLDKKVFFGKDKVRMSPDPADILGFEAFMETYKAGIRIEKAAVDCLRL